ncbi:MAG TPA: hypothetical protein VN258_18865 [Mobilitalea sp.]|nr:hypothetical protein [Mobilitalea sp.]
MKIIEIKRREIESSKRISMIVLLQGRCQVMQVIWIVPQQQDMMVILQVIEQEELEKQRG